MNIKQVQDLIVARNNQSQLYIEYTICRIIEKNINSENLSLLSTNNFLWFYEIISKILVVFCHVSI